MNRSLPTRKLREHPDLDQIYPEQAGDADVDVVHQGQVLVAFGVLVFIDANGVDLAERAVLQSPGDDMFDRIEYPVPGSAKALCGFFPPDALLW